MKFKHEGLNLKVRNPKTGDVTEVLNKDPVTVADMGIYECEFGKECDVPEGYAWPQRASNGSRLPSVIEKLAPQLKPSDEKLRALWSKAPPAGRTDGFRETPVPSIEYLVKQGYPPGVAKQMNQEANYKRESERQARRASAE